MAVFIFMTIFVFKECKKH